MKKVLLTLTLIFTLSMSSNVLFAADYQNEAEALKSLNLFNGTEKGFELERTPKRIEAAAMMVKFLGKEAIANEKKYSHPFTDVPSWATNYVGYLYHEKMTKGLGNNKFGSNNLISAKDFTVFMLKSLNYTDQDFNYNDTMQFALSKGLLSEQDNAALMSGLFTRDKMVHISYNSLSVLVNGEKKTLKEKLIEQNVIKIDETTEVEQAETYVVNIPYADAEKIEYKDDFLTFTSFIRDVSISSINEVGKTLDGYIDDGRDIYFELNSKYTSWNGYNLIVKISMIKDNKVIYSTEAVTRTYEPIKNGTIGQGFVIPADVFDTIQFEITPIKNLNANLNVPITYITTADSEIVKEKIASSYAFSFRQVTKTIFNGNNYEFEEALIRYLQVERSWASMINPYSGVSRLILNNQFTNSYEVLLTGESYSSIGFPPNSGSTVKVSIGTKSISTAYIVICLYDSNKAISEILIVQ